VGREAKKKWEGKRERNEKGKEIRRGSVRGRGGGGEV
jgi:hypothetical protein